MEPQPISFYQIDFLARSIAKKFNLETKHDKYINEKKDVLAQHKGKKRISKDVYIRKQNFYKMPLHENGSPEYTEEGFRITREMIDWDVMEFYGYSCYNKSYEELYK